MRRIKLVLGALAVMVAAFAAVSGPAMADDLNCRDARGVLVRCDGQLFEPVNNNGFNNNGFNNNGFNSFSNDDCEWEFEEGWFLGPWGLQWGTWVLDC
jgi:hypothetical protein